MILVAGGRGKRNQDCSHVDAGPKMEILRLLVLFMPSVFGQSARLCILVCSA